jgi:hypothetical protein
MALLSLVRTRYGVAATNQVAAPSLYRRADRLDDILEHRRRAQHAPGAEGAP